jgi:hypothetical protein
MEKRLITIVSNPDKRVQELGHADPTILNPNLFPFNIGVFDAS